jgi:RNA 2',3'-cyclic 3'-phosphodiesterase
MMETLRTFIAIELDSSLKAALRHVEDLLSGQVASRSVRWVHVEGIHLTLKFLGDTPIQQVEGVRTALAQAAGEVGAFRLAAKGLGCFPNTRRPRVVWVGVEEPSGSLSRLQKAVESHVSPLGFPAERRAFSPHLTLGRVHQYASPSEARRIGDAVAGSAIEMLGEMQATAVSCIKSDLTPSGAVYTRLFEARLGC